MDCIDNFKWVWPFIRLLHTLYKNLANGCTNTNQNRSMQDCFRQHPDIYGGEFEGESPEDDPSYSDPEVDEPSIPPPLDPSLPMPAVDQPSVPLYTSQASIDEPSPASPTSDSRATSASSSMSGYTGTGVESRTTEEPVSESDELVPKALHDTNPPKEGV